MRRLMNFLIMVASAIVLLANGLTIGSPIIGVVGSITYLIVGGYAIRGIFGGRRTFVDSSLGVLMLTVLLGVIGWVFAISYKLGVIEVFITLSVAAFLTLLIQRFTPDGHSPVETFAVETKDDNVSAWARYVEITFVALMCLQIIFLIQSRTPFPVRVWISMDPRVMVLFFINTALLITLMFSSEKWQIKLLLVVGHSILAHMFFVVVFDVGYGWDQWVHLGITRRLFDESSWPQNIGFSLLNPSSPFLKLYRILSGVFQYALSTIFSRMFSVDVHWGHLLLVPLVWGIFIPIIAYRITEIVTEKQKPALLSGLLTLAGPSLILWGAVSVLMSLGFVLFFFVIYLIVDYLLSDRKVIWAALGVFATLITHLTVAIIVSSLFLLAFALKRYYSMKSEKRRRIFLSLAFLVCVGFLPFFYSLGWLFYPIRIGAKFTLKPLLSLPPFDAVVMFLVGAYGNFTLKEAIVYGSLPLLGLLGLIYVNTRQRFVHKNRVNFFLLLAFALLSLEYTITECFMIDVPNPQRLWILRELISIPFASVLIFKAVQIIGNLMPKGIVSRNPSFKGFFSAIRVRGIALKAATLLFVSGLIVSSVYIGYPTVRNTRWLAAHELEAAKYIDSSTNESYVVLCYNFFMIAGYAAVGLQNPRAHYFSAYGQQGARLFREAREGSAEAMIEAAKVNNASTVFFVISKFRVPNADSVINLLLGRPGFELVGTFGDDVYVFRYMVPRERVVRGMGPSVYVYSDQKYVNTTFVADIVTFEAEYVVSLNGSSSYKLTGWPAHWSPEDISPKPITRDIDANLWINFTGEENVEYNVSWTANVLYRNVGWKDDSFVTEWTRYKTGPPDFREETILQTDGDVLTMTGNFRRDERDYYWIWKPVNVDTDLYPYALVRWRSTGYCAIAWAYLSGGEKWNQRILDYGSYSADWTTTVVRLEEHSRITYLMVGLEGGADLEGSHSAYFDFVMVANATSWIPPQ